MPYHSTSYFTDRWNIPIRRIQHYCKNGQVIGCRKVSGKWEIPDNAIKPVEKKDIPFLLMYYNCFQTGLDIRTTNIPNVQRFIALDYSANAKKYLIQMGYMDENNCCTPAGIEMMSNALRRELMVKFSRWALETIPQYLQFLPYLS